MNFVYIWGREALWEAKHRLYLNYFKTELLKVNIGQGVALKDCDNLPNFEIGLIPDLSKHWKDALEGKKNQP